MLLDSWPIDRGVSQSHERTTTFTALFQSISHWKPPVPDKPSCWKQDRKAMVGGPPCSDGLTNDDGVSNASVRLRIT